MWMAKVSANGRGALGINERRSVKKASGNAALVFIAKLIYNQHN